MADGGVIMIVLMKVREVGGVIMIVLLEVRVICSARNRLKEGGVHSTKRKEAGKYETTYRVSKSPLLMLQEI